MAKAESLRVTPSAPLAAAGRKVSTGNFTDCQGLSLWERWHRASDDGEGKPADKNAPRKFRLRLLKVYPIVSSS